MRKTLDSTIPRFLKTVLFIIMLSGIKFYFELLTLWHFTNMERVKLKDMTTLEDEAKIEREQCKLAQKKIACFRSP